MMVNKKIASRDRPRIDLQRLTIYSKHTLFICNFQEIHQPLHRPTATGNVGYQKWPCLFSPLSLAVVLPSQYFGSRYVL